MIRSFATMQVNQARQTGPRAARAASPAVAVCTRAAGRPVVSLSTLAVFALSIHLAQAAAAQESDPTAILQKVDAATKAVREISYKAECWGEGTVKDQVPRGKGVIRAKAEGEKSLDDWSPRLSLEISLQARDGQKGYTLITDGKDGMLLMPEEKKYKRASFDTFDQQVRTALETVYMVEYMHPKPFSDELNGDKRTFEGAKTIGGVLCNVIHVAYNNNQGEARWYFGQKDNLPRRVDRLIKDGARVLELSDVNVSPGFDDKAFALTPPAGFEDDSPGLLPAGRKAPEFSLKSPDGKTTALSDLKGKVVLLDFWATWCPPCKKAMPTIQKIHDANQGKPLVVVGMNCWEKEGADPAAFIKEAGHTYSMLLAADEAARLYRVKSIPAFFVIAPDGTIAYSASGFEATTEESLKKAVEAAMAKAAK